MCWFGLVYIISHGFYTELDNFRGIKFVRGIPLASPIFAITGYVLG